MSLLFKPLLIEFYLVKGSPPPNCSPREVHRLYNPAHGTEERLVSSPTSSPSILSVFSLSGHLFPLEKSDSSPLKKDTLQRGNTKADYSWPKFHSAPPKALHRGTRSSWLLQESRHCHHRARICCNAVKPGTDLCLGWDSHWHGEGQSLDWELGWPSLDLLPMSHLAKEKSPNPSWGLFLQVEKEDSGNEGPGSLQRWDSMHEGPDNKVSLTGKGGFRPTPMDLCWEATSWKVSQAPGLPGYFGPLSPLLYLSLSCHHSGSRSSHERWPGGTQPIISAPPTDMQNSQEHQHSEWIWNDVQLAGSQCVSGWFMGTTKAQAGTWTKHLWFFTQLA